MIKTNNSVSNSFAFALPAVMWQVLFFYVPVAMIISLSFLKPDQEWVLTAQNYAQVSTPLYFWIIARSLCLALATACFCLLLAYPIAYFIAVRIKRGKNIFLYLLILPFWTSLMVQVYSWFFILEHNGLINTTLMKLGLINQPLHLLNNTLAIYIVMVYCYLPFMIMPLYTTLEKFDRRLLEAAADLGASQWQTFRKVTLPMTIPGIRTGFFLVFIPAFGEFVVPVLLGGGKQLFVGPLITQYFLTARNPFAGAAFTVLSSIILLLSVWIIYQIFKKNTAIVQRKS